MMTACDSFALCVDQDPTFALWLVRRAGGITNGIIVMLIWNLFISARALLLSMTSLFFSRILVNLTAHVPVRLTGYSRRETLRQPSAR
jgi:hypothetical protein